VRDFVITLSGLPIPKQSARFYPFKKKDGKTIVKSFQPAKITEKEYSYQMQLIDVVNKIKFVPFSKFVIVENIRFVFPILKSASKKLRQLIILAERHDYIPLYDEGLSSYKKTTKPDLDNLEKMLWYCFNGIVFTDDSLICEKHNISKVYGTRPRTEISLIGE
jgi:Holliday junction resolvase RusA-like endonuclease